MTPPAGPISRWRISFKSWRAILWRLFWGVGENRIMLTAAGVTYYSLLALVPALTCFITVYGLFATPFQATTTVDLLRGIVPDGGLDIIREQLVRLASEDTGTLSLTLVVSLAITLWSAGAGFRALFEAMNIAYKEQEKRNFLYVTLLAFGFTMAGTLAAAIVLSSVLIVPIVLAFFSMGASINWLVRAISYGAMLAVFFLGLAALYRWGPSREASKRRWVTHGSIFAVLGVTFTSVLYSWYAGNLGDFSATYGTLGTLIGFLTWIWLSMTIVIMGALLNAEVERQMTLENQSDAS